MEERKSRTDLVSESDYVRVEVVEGQPFAALSIDEVRRANEAYFTALGLTVGPAAAKQACDDLLKQIEEASAEDRRRGTDRRIIRVTRLH